MAGLITALEPVKVRIDAAWTAKAQEMSSERMPDPISWADLIAMAAVVAQIQKWGGSPEGGWPVRQGRSDVLEADPSGRSLSMNADVDTALAWFNKRGIHINAALPIWMEITDNLDSVKANPACAKLMAAYEADPAMFQKGFMMGFTQLSSLGTYYDAFAYFYDENPYVVRDWYKAQQAQQL